MNDLIDFHIHIPYKSKTPAADFKKEIQNLKAFNLIINNNEEFYYLKTLINDGFFLNWQNSLISLSFDVLCSNPLAIKEMPVRTGMKIHPRLSEISLDKFPSVANIIMRENPSFLIVDSFYYGSSIQFHTNLDLAIFLANKFNDKNILLCHAGGHKLLETMLYTRDLKNVFYDLSFTVNYLADTSIALDIVNHLKHNSSKTLFGSDFPEFSIEEALEKYTTFMDIAGLNEDQKNSILSKNFLNFR